MTRMTGPGCAVMCNLKNTHSHTHNKEAGGGAQGAQGSSKICTSRESVSPLSRLIRGFRNKYDWQCEWHRLTRMTGPDCAVMFNLINTNTHTHTHAVMCNLINTHTHTHTHRNKYH